MNKFHLYIHQPEAVFKARVNMASVTYPLTELTYNAVTLGAYTDIEPDMTLLLGTTEGDDDLGRVRIKSLADADTIFIPRTARGVEDGTLEVTASAYITVLDDFRVWAKIPYFDVENGIDYKDGTQEVLDHNVDIPPVANAGAGFADYIDSISSVITVDFDASLSIAVADGATITTYAWDVKDGTITVGTSADAQITATFPAGFRWVTVTVTDSNGKFHTARCPVLAVDPDDDVTVESYQLTQRLEKSGQTVSIDIYKDLARDTYLDGTLVMFWWDEPATPSDRDHMKFIGWLDTENTRIGRVKTGIRRSLSFQALDINGKLNKLPGFPQALYREEEKDSEDNPALPWGYMPSLDMHKSLIYLLFWHSTALELGDFILPAGLQSYDAMRLDSGAGTLFSQVDQQAQKIVPDHYFTCNSKGQMEIKRDWMLDDVGSRPIASPIITVSEWNNLSYEYNRHPKIHVLRSGAIGVSTDWIDDGQGNDTLPTFFSIAPGDSATFSQGTSESTENEGLTLSQDDLNRSEGHRYARLNSRFGMFSFDDPTVVDFWEYEPALFNRVQFNLSSIYTDQRGLPFTQMNGLVHSIDVRYTASKTGSRRQVSVQYEKEVEGFSAIATYPDDTVVTPDPIPLTPPGEGLLAGQENVAGIGDDGYVYRTSDFQTVSGSGGPTWDRVDLGIATPIFSWVVDPFSPGYINGTGFINGWVVNETDIYRVEDLFGTPSVNSVHTFTNAVDKDAGHWRTIQASFGTYFSEGSNPWLLCISHYGSTTGHTGTYALRSVDGGATWLGETEVSPHYDPGPVQKDLPIAVYTSPKTPGLAYTVAFIDTFSPGFSDGYISEDWGETWTRVSGEVEDDVNAPLPRWRTWDDVAGAYISGSTLSGMYSESISVAASGASGFDEENHSLTLGAPADAKRVEISGRWTDEWSRTGSPTFVGGVTPRTSGAGLSITEDIDHVRAAAPGGLTWEDFTITWNFSGGDWPNNKDVILSSVTIFGARLELKMSIATGTGESGQEFITAMMRVTEIELDDATIYTPGIIGAGWLQPENGFAGALHLPWPDNDDEAIGYYGYIERLGTITYKLIQSINGTNTDISPSSGGVSYGVNHYGFSVRSYDNDRQFMALGGIGNDAGTDKVGLWVSDDAGATWTEILAPIALSANALYGLQIAFARDDENALYTWGGYSNGSIPAISYTDDFGATLDSREGNINSLGTVAFIGIAGGPTG